MEYIVPSLVTSCTDCYKLYRFLSLFRVDKIKTYYVLEASFFADRNQLHFCPLLNKPVYFSLHKSHITSFLFIYFEPEGGFFNRSALWQQEKNSKSGWKLHKESKSKVIKSWRSSKLCGGKWSRSWLNPELEKHYTWENTIKSRLHS